MSRLGRSRTRFERCRFHEPAFVSGAVVNAAPQRSQRDSRRPHLLDPEGLSAHIDPMYRAAWALCGSRHDAEDLVQETLANVLKRPRLLRDGNEIGYLLRALRNTYASHYRAAKRRPQERQLFEDDGLPSQEPGVSSREIMEAIASVPAAFRDAVIAVDLLGLSYREAARSLRIPEATITTRLHRGRQHVARTLIDETDDGSPDRGVPASASVTRSRIARRR
jgi:RNA polymerase sigma-70 factor (ECF subfamily)